MFFPLWKRCWSWWCTVEKSFLYTVRKSWRYTDKWRQFFPFNLDHLLFSRNTLQEDNLQLWLTLIHVNVKECCQILRGVGGSPKSITGISGKICVWIKEGFRPLSGCGGYHSNLSLKVDKSVSEQITTTTIYDAFLTYVLFLFISPHCKFCLKGGKRRQTWPCVHLSRKRPFKC